MTDPTHLLLAAADGDQSALASFVAATQADVWRFCAHLVDRDAADDLVQDTYLRAARSMHGFRGDGSGLAWLLTIARRTCADHLQRATRRRGREATTDPRDLAGVSTPGDVDATAEVADLVARLPHGQREALVLTTVIGLSYAESAHTVGVPVGTIRSRVARARSRLSDLLQAAESGRGSDADRPRSA